MKKKLKKKIQEIKIHAIRSFPAGSFAVHIGDHLRFGIICGPIWGSFAVWGSFAALYSSFCFNFLLILLSIVIDNWLVCHRIIKEISKDVCNRQRKLRTLLGVITIKCRMIEMIRIHEAFQPEEQISNSAFLSVCYRISQRDTAHESSIV